MNKRRKLALLVIEGDSDFEKKHNVIGVNRQAFHVIQIFMHFLPRIDLDGSSKLTIFFKSKEGSEQQYVHVDLLGVSWYYVDDEEIERQRHLKKEEQEEYYLSIIVDTLKSIAQIDGRDDEIYKIIDETAQKVKDNNFELTLPIKKLAKSSADGQFRAYVYRHISNQGESWYVEMKDKNNSKSVTRHDINLLKKPSYISKTGLYEQSRWEGNCFIVSDRLGRVAAMINV